MAIERLSEIISSLEYREILEGNKAAVIDEETKVRQESLTFRFIENVEKMLRRIGIEDRKRDIILKKITTLDDFEFKEKLDDYFARRRQEHHPEIQKLEEFLLRLVLFSGDNRETELLFKRVKYNQKFLVVSGNSLWCKLRPEQPELEEETIETDFPLSLEEVKLLQVNLELEMRGMSWKNPDEIYNIAINLVLADEDRPLRGLLKDIDDETIIGFFRASEDRDWCGYSSSNNYIGCNRYIRVLLEEEPGSDAVAIIRNKVRDSVTPKGVRILDNAKIALTSRDFDTLGISSLTFRAILRAFPQFSLPVSKVSFERPKSYLNRVDPVYLPGQVQSFLFSLESVVEVNGATMHNPKVDNFSTVTVSFAGPIFDVAVVYSESSTYSGYSVAIGSVVDYSKKTEVVEFKTETGDAISLTFVWDEDRGLTVENVKVASYKVYVPVCR